ncbi:hypothetical protein CHS0354_011632 [Potamilus streckersoni]|uniref:Uncharacterized protein n=1 Tax=Potamilus streckersoni TaxID=2493646 RepID=A0AAE0TL59_9BIVA|nr:hypothetical protein CHS0354_011632 [Potamilus streckersoni]
MDFINGVYYDKPDVSHLRPAIDACIHLNKNVKHLACVACCIKKIYAYDYVSLSSPEKQNIQDPAEVDGGIAKDEGSMSSCLPGKQLEKPIHRLGFSSDRMSSPNVRKLSILLSAMKVSSMIKGIKGSGVCLFVPNIGVIICQIVFVMQCHVPFQRTYSY